MINRNYLSNYYQVARMNQSLNSFISQARAAKRQINSSISSSSSLFTKHTGIGSKVNLLA